MKIMKNKVPKFKDEFQEKKFWASNDSVDLVDWKKAKKTLFPNLKPSVRSVSIRLPESMLEELRLLANRRDVPYQSLLKIFLAERIEQELHPHRGLIF